MLLTVEEANDKGCPYCWSKDGQHTVMYSCIGSRCMMWRWGSGPASAGEVRSQQRQSESLGEAYKRMCKGYCGLAGRPE